MKTRLSKLTALALSLAAILTACNATPEDVNSRIDNQTSYTSNEIENLGESTLEQVLGEAESLQGRKYNQFTLPKTIYIDKEAEFHSFTASYSDKEVCSLDDFFLAVSGISINEATVVDEKCSIYGKNNSDETFYVYMKASYGQYLGNIQSYALQGAQQNQESCPTESVISLGQENKYSNVINNCNERYKKITSLVKTNAFNYRLSDYVELECEEQKIDYFNLAVEYKGIPLNRFLFSNNNFFSDATQNIYRERDKNQISFIDDNVAYLEMSFYSEPNNVETYDKIIGLEKALSILSERFSSSVSAEFEKVDLVYIGETKDYHVDESGTFIPNNIYGAYDYHPYWQFITTPESAMGDIYNGNSCFIVDALTGEASTYTELKR